MTESNEDAEIDEIIELEKEAVAALLKLCTAFHSFGEIGRSLYVLHSAHAIISGYDPTEDEPDLMGQPPPPKTNNSDPSLS